MMDEERLDDLLLRWEELSEAGEVVSVETLCQDCPHLRDELQRRIEALQRVSWVCRVGQAWQESTAFIALAAGSEVVPGYRLVKRLGKGGFAEVWKAEGPHGPVALKCILQSDNAARVERRSLAVLQHLHHPNLLSTFDTWQVNGFFIVAMELADGTLMDRWRQAQSQGLSGIPRDELICYLRDAAEGLDFLQKRYIQHRDVKPQNLFLVGPTLKVGDFGLTRLLAHSITGHSGSLTLSYAPPEYFEGKTTRQSDVYSLAVAYCQMAAGKLPFEGSPAALVAAHLHRRPDLSMLPLDERPAVAKALAKRPEERWPTCRAFVEALANPQGLTTQTPRHREDKRKTTRSRMLKRLGLLFLVCLLCVLVSLWFVLRPQPTVTTAPFPAFETPRLPPHSHNLIRNVAVARLEEPFNGFVALSNGAGGPKLWDVTTGKVIRYLSEQGGPGIALAPLGLPLGLSGGDDGNVILWDLRDGREVRRFEGHSRSVSSVAFSPDGSQVLTGGCDGTVRLFDRRTGKELHCLHGHRSIVMSVAFDPRGRRALSGGWDGTVRTWDLETGKQITLFDGHSGQVWCVACSPNGRWGVSSGTDRMLRLWDVASGREVRRFTGHTDLVAHVSFLPFNRLLSVGGDQSVRTWDVRTGRELYRAPKLSSFGWCAAFLDLNTIPTLVIGTEKNGLQLWRLPQE